MLACIYNIISELTPQKHGNSYLDTYEHKVCTNAKKQRLLFFFGTRPETIKMGPIIQKAIEMKIFEVMNIFTGQHVDIIEPFINFFNITIHYELSTRSYTEHSVSLLLSRIIVAIEKNIPLCYNDIWVVQGDTTTALAASIIAFSNNITLAHVEAGLRTYDVKSPFPEEFNRRTISLISSYNFAPSKLAYKNLQVESVQLQNTYITGNTGIDTVRLFSKYAQRPPSINFYIAETRLILVTMHRRENFVHIGDILKTINSVICTDCMFILPLHPNQNSAKPVKEACSMYSRFKCIPGMNVNEMYWTMNRVHFIMTDSGGIQEEASWFHKPVLVLRDKTERVESIDAKISVLVGRNASRIRFYMTQLLNISSVLYQNMTKPVFPYGDGFSSEKILTVLSTAMVRAHTQNKTSQMQIKSHENLHTKLAFIPQSRRVFTEDFANSNKKIVRLCTARQDPVRFACSRANTIGVVLTVYKRKTLSQQLDAAALQTMQPSVIHVHHNDNFVSHEAVMTEISMFKKKYVNISVAYTHHMQNSRFHARFFTAYMLDTEFVSVWDDDQIPASLWLENSVKLSLQNSNALIGANARNLRQISLQGEIRQSNAEGFVDFVGHIWTVYREYLRFFLGDLQYTYTTGEDVQLSFSLQKRNISSMFSLVDMNVESPDTVDSASSVASYRTKDLKYHATRNLLFCQLLHAGFKTKQCENCNSANIQKCINFYSKILNV